jgi:phage tail tape-measure protein
MSGSLRLSILIEAIDRASQPLARLQARLGGIAAGMLAVGQAAQRLSNVSGASVLAGALGNVAGRARDAAGAVAGLSAKLAIGAAGGAYLFNQQFVRGAADFQRYRTTLETVMGSAEAAQTRLNELTQFATRTPFSVAEVVRAGVALQTFGVRGAAADAALRGAGNAAHTFESSLDQAITAMAAAGRGELDPIERFGIQARTEGRAIVMQWEQDGKQMRATIDKNNRAGIMATVARAWNGMAPGAMEKAMDQWDGLLSNVKDAWSSFTRTIAEAGPFQFLEQQLRDILAWVERLKEDGRLDEWARDIGTSITRAFTAIRNFVVGTEDTPGAFERLSNIFERVSKVLGPIVRYFGGLETFLAAIALTLGSGLLVSLGLLGKAMITLSAALLLTPVGWFVAAAAFFAALGYLVYENWDGIVAVWDKISAAFRAFFDSEQMQEAKRIFGSLGDFIIDAWNGVGQVFTNIGNVIKGVFADVLTYFQPVRDALSWVADRLGIGGGSSSAPAAPTPRDAGRGNALRRQSIYGDNALPSGAAGGVLPPANDVRLNAGLDVNIRAPEGFGVSVTQRGADDGMALNVRRGMLATP